MGDRNTLQELSFLNRTFGFEGNIDVILLTQFSEVQAKKRKKLLILLCQIAFPQKPDRDRV